MTDFSKFFICIFCINEETKSENKTIQFNTGGAHYLFQENTTNTKTANTESKNHLKLGVWLLVVTKKKERSIQRQKIDLQN